MSDTTREAVNLTGLDDYLRDPSVGLPWDIRIRIADALRLQQAEIDRLTAAHDTVCGALAQAITERDDALTRLAGAYEAAAGDCAAMADQVANAAITGLPEQSRMRESMEAAFTKAAHRIRALTPADAQAALDDRISAAPSTPVDNKISADPVGKEG